LDPGEVSHAAEQIRFANNFLVDFLVNFLVHFSARDDGTSWTTVREIGRNRNRPTTEDM
jgi:hypothetical protein